MIGELWNWWLEVLKNEYIEPRAILAYDKAVNLDMQVVPVLRTSHSICMQGPVCVSSDYPFFCKCIEDLVFGGSRIELLQVNDCCIKYSLIWSKQVITGIDLEVVGGRSRGIISHLTKDGNEKYT